MMPLSSSSSSSSSLVSPSLGSRRRGRESSSNTSTTASSSSSSCHNCSGSTHHQQAQTHESRTRRRRPHTSSSSSSTMTFLAAAATLACCCTLSSAATTSFSPPPMYSRSFSSSSRLVGFLPPTTGTGPSMRPSSMRRRARPPSTLQQAAASSTMGAGGMKMISSMFRWRGGKNEDEEEVLVNIESPSANVRRISSSIVINRPLSDVWRILTDYDNLSEYVPNLTQSRLVNPPPGWQPRTKNKEVRLFQEGAQTIIGFNFKASLTMDMEEVFEGEDEKLGQRRIKFRLVDSAMFSDFSGEWRLQCYSRMRTACEAEEWTYSTKLFYMVNVKPKGPVPVGALEWRIKEDVPTNLRAVKVASEKLPWECAQDQAALAALAAGRREQQSRMSVSQDWMSDETLGAYIGEGGGRAGGAPQSTPLGGGGGATAVNNKDDAVLRVGVGSGGPPGGKVDGRMRNETSSSSPSMFERFFLRQEE